MPVLTAASVFRRYETDGVPDSGPHNVIKDEVVQYLHQLEEHVAALVGQPPGRLSLVDGVAAPESDVATATEIFYVSVNGSRVPVFDGSRMSGREPFGTLSLVLDANTGHAQYHATNIIFDVFAFWDDGVLRLGTASWNSGGGGALARGTGVGSAELSIREGLLVNANDTTLRYGSGSGDIANVDAEHATYLGSFCPTANGVATDTKARRRLFNAYNQAIRHMAVHDTTAFWTYSTAAYHTANNNGANALEFLIALAGTVVEATASSIGFTSTTTDRDIQNAIGLDSSTVPAADSVTGFQNVINRQRQLVATYRGTPGLGLHFLIWLERGAGSDIQTWIGTTTDTRTGIVGSFLG